MWKKTIDKNLIIINPEIKSKKDLFEGMVNHVYNHDYIINQKKFLEALYEREEMSSTELMQGVAFPHARSNTVDKLFLSIIILKDGIDYENPEMGPTKIIFFFGCPKKEVKEYLQLLAKSSRVLKNEEFREKLLQCTTPDEIIDLLHQYSEEEDEIGRDGDHLLILTLNDVGKTSEVMSSMVELGITNASIVDAISMAKKLAYEMPIFAGLSYMTQGKSKKSILIFAHIENKEKVHKLAKLLKENGIDLDKKGVGFIQIIKVETVIGNYEEEIEL